jgi:hypothetical protein
LLTDARVRATLETPLDIACHERMEERRKSDRRDPAARDALSTEVLRLLRVCGANVRSADDPEQVLSGAPTDRRRESTGPEDERVPGPAPR